MRVRWCWTQQEMREEWWLPKAGKARRKGHVQRTGEESPAALVICLSCATESLPETTEKEFIELSPWPFTSWQWGWIMGRHLLSDRSREQSRLRFWYNNLQGCSPSIYSLLRPCVSKCWHFAKYFRPLGLHIPHLSLLGMFCSQT